MGFGPLEGHRPLQHRNVFVPRELIFTPSGAMAAPQRVRGSSERPAGEELRLELSAPRRRRRSHGRVFEAQAAGMGLAVMGIQPLLEAVRPEMAGSEYRQRRGPGWGLGEEKGPAEETTKEGAESLERSK